MRRLTLAFIVAFAMGFGAAHIRKPVKRTGECMLVDISGGGHNYWFVRPNKEVFEMYFDNPPNLRPPGKFEYIAYTDDNADLRHFVSAKFK